MVNNNLEKLFLKNKYYVFKNRKFNFGAFIGGYLYLFYRKLYGLGTIIMVINILLYYFKLYWPIGIINIILGIIFNRLYLRIVNKKIMDYKLNYMDDGNVIKECNKKKTNYVIVIIISFVSFVIIIISFIAFSSYKVSMGNLSLRLENTWDKSSYNNQYYSSYNYEDDNNNCSLTLEIISFGDVDEFINSMVMSYEGSNKIDDIVINGSNYKMAVIENNDIYNYVYVTKYEDELYVILFDIYYDNGICNKYRESILDGVKIKN